MKQSEAAKIVAQLMAVLPRAKVGENTSAAYEMFLGDLDAAECMRAVRGIIATWDNPYALPTVGQIRKAVTGADVNDKSGELAWATVLKAVGSVGFYGTPSFEDPLTEIALATIGWRALCKKPEAELGYCQNQFVKAYNAARARIVDGGSVARLEEHQRHKLAGQHECDSKPARGQLTSIKDAIAKVVD